MKIKRRFLWGRVIGGSNVAWVMLCDVCKEKKFGGLSIFDLWVVNLAPLDKWKRQLISVALGIWCNI